MKLGADPDPRMTEPAHIEAVVEEIRSNFDDYFATFAASNLRNKLASAVQAHTKEQQAYREYLKSDILSEYESDPGAFKATTRKKCPIIRRCLMSKEEFMKVYQIEFGNVSGRDLLDVVRRLSSFAIRYTARFQDEAHEAAQSPQALELDPLDTDPMYLRGVVGYGIQGSLLHGAYPREFAHRSQNSVWALYFLSGRKDFGLTDGSEFMMVQEKYGTADQNYFYHADLFGFYSLQLYLMLKHACAQRGIPLDRWKRYIYLSTFCDHVADRHRADINAFRWSSEDVESRGWY
jgi:hypothetical protein